MPECGSPPTSGAASDVAARLWLELPIPGAALLPLSPRHSAAPLYSASTVIPPTPPLPACGIPFTR